MKRKRKLEKLLEDLCTFADECATSNYGNFEICKKDYVNCVHYQRTIARKIEEYNEKNREEKLK